jgi:NTP pyrophosphatase (non-canonical NTP hydrolase)
MTTPWTFATGTNTIESAVYQAMGGASGCWETLTGAGEFDSGRCLQISEILLDFIRTHTETIERAPYLVILSALNSALGDGRNLMETVDVQMLCLAEETGEAIKAWRRFTNRARVSEDLDHVAEELADVLIVTRLAMLMLGVREKEVVQKKLVAIAERGGR